ncbi:MAG: GPR endopeptidase [Mollicutes bacterium]|nr:GPR endopeptidase [Mollicutes bacterium]
MHEIDLNKKDLRTDLILEKQYKNLESKTTKYKDIEIITTKYKNNNYTTIYFNDATDKDNYLNLEKVLIKELKKYINIKENDTILVVGLGNSKSTPDALGPSTIDDILVTRHLKLLNVLDKDYSVVSTFKPSVMGTTGIESIDLIKNIIKDIKATKVIVLDALKASKIERLVKTIQITDSGIHPGSGINNNRGEVSKNTMKTDVISIGIPTVVDIKTILESILEEEIELDENLILTPTDIDYQIEKLSKLLSISINKTLHKKLYPTK